MPDALVTDSTSKQLAKLARGSTGSYLFLGPDGIGKFYIAYNFATQICTQATNILVVEPTSDSIGIDRIHDLNRQLALRTTADDNRVVIIRDADKMTTEAQNALLKTLEEPPAKTMILLTAAERYRLLITIISRCQILQLSLLPETTVADYLKQQLALDTKSASYLARVSEGAIGKAINLSTDEAVLSLLTKVDGIVDLLLDGKATSYEKMRVINGLEGEIDPKMFVARLGSRLRTELRQAAAKDDPRLFGVIINALKHVSRISRYLSANGNAKLALTEITLGFGKYK